MIARLCGITGVAVFCFVTALLTGCSRSPKVSFYTLGSVAQTGAASQSKSAPSVSIAALTLPELVNRPQLVEYINGNRVEILETHRWAEPLKNGITRLLLENLAVRLGSDRVIAYPQNSAGEPDYKVTVDIRRFESTHDAVSVDAVWTVCRAADKAPKTGRSQVRESRGGGSFEALVAAYNRAIVSVGDEIAQAIHADWVSAPASRSPASGP